VGRKHVHLLEVRFSPHEVYEGEADDPGALTASDPKAAVALRCGELMQRGLLLEHLDGDLPAREEGRGFAFDPREHLKVIDAGRPDGEG
jgi:hypothetical protein